MTRPQRTAEGCIVTPQEVRHHDLMKAHVPEAAIHLEDAGVFVEARVPDPDLVRNAAHERFIGERLGRKIRREDNERVEGHLEFHPRCEG